MKEIRAWNQPKQLGDESEHKTLDLGRERNLENGEKGKGKRVKDYSSHKSLQFIPFQ